MKPSERMERWNPLLCTYPDSEKVNAVSWQAETMFTRLLAKTDDYGNYDGSPALLLCGLFAKRFEKGEISVTDTARIRDELVSAGLIVLYEVGGKTYLHVLNCKKCNRKDVKEVRRYPDYMQQPVIPGLIEPGPDSARTRPEIGPLEPRTNNLEPRTEEDSEPHGSEQQPAGGTPISLEAINLARLLFDLMRKNNPRCREPNMKAWAKTVDLMLRIDKRTRDEVERILRWSQADTFWHKNILSPEKLRKHFDRMTMQADGNKNRTKAMLEKM